MSDQTYYTLGNSSLTVSRLAFGVMTFGSYEGMGTTDWGASEQESRRMFDAYRDWGGNFLDTAPSYTFGESEKLLGRFMQESGCRQDLVVSTKFAHPPTSGGPNGGGAGRINVIRSVEQSLQRLQTDYIDLLFLHSWDRRTPPEELANTLNDLVRQGKVRYIGMSNLPAWYVAKLQTIAELRGLERLCALQLEYSLVNRELDDEYVPLCLDSGISLTSYAPLAAGFLTGKYKGVAQGATLTGDEGRLASMKDIQRPQVQKFSERNWRIHDAVEEVAKALDRSMSQVAINWAVNRPAMGAVICGASKLSQLEDNLKALDFEMPKELADRLTEISEVSRIERPMPHAIFGREYQKGSLHGGLDVREKAESYYSVD